jgi:hypothetical protein
MKSLADLRALASMKQHAAAVARRAGPALTLAADREPMHRHSLELEAEAAAFEAEANAINGEGPSSAE